MTECRECGTQVGQFGCKKLIKQSDGTYLGEDCNETYGDD